MKNRFKPIILMIAFFAIAVPVSTQAKDRSKNPSSTGEMAPKVADFIENAKQRIAVCEGQYDKFSAESFAAERSWESENKAEEAESRYSGKPIEVIQMRQTSPYHKICSESAKQDFIPTAKTFIRLFKNKETQKNAKDMVAQWITAIDAIGDKGAQSELAKFETLANGLLLDF